MEAEAASEVLAVAALEEVELGEAGSSRGRAQASEGGFPARNIFSPFLNHLYHIIRQIGVE